MTCEKRIFYHFGRHWPVNMRSSSQRDILVEIVLRKCSVKNYRNTLKKAWSVASVGNYENSDDIEQTFFFCV